VLPRRDGSVRLGELVAQLIRGIDPDCIDERRQKLELLLVEIFANLVPELGDEKLEGELGARETYNLPACPLDLLLPDEGEVDARITIRDDLADSRV
jgi:hypothetical protein